MSSFDSKLPGIKTSIFAVMSQLANEHQAINLSQGFPDFPVSEELIDLVSFYMKKGMNQYAPMPGLPELRKTLCEKQNAIHDSNYCPVSEITITAGATQAIQTAIATVIRPGDEVIIFEPSYDAYGPLVNLHEGIPVYLQLQAPNFSINWDEVANAVTDKTRMIVVNSPHNPTGASLSKEDLDALASIVKDKEIYILSDEVYEHIIFDGAEHQSISRHPELKEKAFVTGSFGKTFHTTGWKLGYVFAPEYLMTPFRMIHQFVVYSVNTPMQYAVNDYLQDEKNYLSISPMYQQKRDFVLEALKGSKFEMIPSTGSYFQLLDYSKISDEKDTDFSIRVTKEFGVASIPLSPFYHNDESGTKLIRLCFAKKEETLKDACEKLKRL